MVLNWSWERIVISKNSSGAKGCSGKGQTLNCARPPGSFEKSPTRIKLSSTKATPIKLGSGYVLSLQPTIKKGKTHLVIQLIPPGNDRKAKSATLSCQKPSVILTPVQKKGSPPQHLVVLLDYLKSES